MKKIRWEKIKACVAQKSLRIGLFIVVAGLLTAIIFTGKRPYGGQLHEGDISLRSIYSPVDFSYRAGIDEAKTQSMRQEAMEKISDIYTINRTASENILGNFDEFFANVSSLQKVEGVSEKEKEEKLEGGLTTAISDSSLKVFIQSQHIEQVRENTNQLLNQLLSKGLLNSEAKNELINAGKQELIIRDPESEAETPVSIAEIATADDAGKAAMGSAHTLFPEDRKMRAAVLEVISAFLRPNLSFNEEETLRRRHTAAEEIPLQYKEITVKQEELIIAKGQKVTKDHLIKLTELFKRQAKANKASFLAGIMVLVFTFMVIVAVYLRLYEAKVFPRNQDLLLAGLLAILVIAVAKLITLSPLPSYFIPIAIASMLIAMLIGSSSAFMVTVTLSLLIGIIVGARLEITLVSLIGGVVGIYSVRGIRRRAHLLRAGLLVGLANFACIVGIGFLHNLRYTIFLREGLWGIGNGIISGIIVTGILPVIEYVFKITTNISLLELSDRNHPLLKELVIKAPGTYHHSLIVGNLAEAACEAIGANSLLARIGSYFHDIGKIEKPEYFSENQKDVQNRHAKLTPTMSTLIITNHVKEGVELAHKYRLNRAIVDFIEQHHGTSVTYYFYQRALEEYEHEGELEEEGFRYTGPKPQTKETAIVLLADSVEAASRTLSDPTPARIRGLVRKIINNKFIDTQLEDCELTLKDLNKISEAFVHILTGIFHTRVEYPTKDENRGKELPQREGRKFGKNKKSGKTNSGV